MAAWTYNTEQIPITGDGASMYMAAKQVNTYFNQLSAEWFAFVYQYNDARASEVISVSYDDLETGVYNYLSAANYTYTGSNLATLVLDKLYQLPDHLQHLMYHTYHAPEMYQQKAGLLDTPRVLYYDGTTGMWRFANNKNLTDSFADFTGVIGNVYPAERRIELVLNGVIYNYSEQPFIPGEVYYLTDLLDGWMVPYQEGGEGRIISVPMAVATGRNSAILLSNRGITKDLPCEKVCPPVSLNWRESQLMYSPTFEPDCDNVVLHLPSNMTDPIVPPNKIFDRSKYQHVMVHDSALIAHSNDYARYGTSSIKSPGIEDALVTTSPGNKMDLDDNDFCIEFWVMFEDQMRHDFIMGLYDETNRRKSWHIESPGVNSGLGTGMVFTVNNGVESDDFKIRLGFDYEFDNNTWYHVALSRRRDEWRWLVNGLEQESRLTDGLLNTTIPKFSNPEFRLGAPGQSTHTDNISAVVLDGLKIDSGEVRDASIDDIYPLDLLQDTDYISDTMTCDTYTCSLSLDIDTHMLDVSQATPLLNGEFYGSGSINGLAHTPGTSLVSHNPVDNTYQFKVKHRDSVHAWHYTHYSYSMFNDEIVIDSDAGEICVSYEATWTSNLVVAVSLLIKQNGMMFVNYIGTATNNTFSLQNINMKPENWAQIGGTARPRFDRGDRFSVGITFGQSFGTPSNTIATLRSFNICIGSPDYVKASNTCTVYLTTPVDTVDFVLLRTRDVPPATTIYINLLDQHDNWIQAVTYEPKTGDPRIMTQTQVLTAAQPVHAIQWALTGTDLQADTQLLQLKSGTRIREWAEFRTARNTRTVPLLGYLDDIRITNGESVYTGNFKSTGVPHPTCA